MIRKVKIKIRADKHNINLPAIPISFFRFGIKTVLRFVGRSDDLQAHSDKLEKQMHAYNNNDIEIYDNGDVIIVDENGNDCEDKFDLDFKDGDIDDILKFVDKFLNDAKQILNEMDSFTLIEVNAPDVHVLIEMR